MKSFRFTVLALMLGVSVASAQKKPAAPAAPAKAAAPAAKAAAPAAKGATGAASTAGKAGGATTTASKGPTTAGRTTTTTTTASRTTTTAGGRTTTTTTARSTTSTGVGAHTATPTAHAMAGGGAAMHTNTGVRAVPANNRVVHGPGGNEVRMRPNGRPGDVHVAGRNMDIHHGLNGNRRIEVERADHSRLVSERGGRGYIQRGYGYHGHEFARRSYYYHGRAYDHYYGHYMYRGAYVNYYTPSYYYRPAFYGWAYNPWVAPVPYAWGFAANPWYGYYGAAYFAPYPVYPSASLWLTDYLISVSLASAFEAQAQAAAAQQAAALPPDAAGLTPDVKNLIAAEVQRQIALENSEAQAVQANPEAVADPASSSVQRLLTDNVQHVFIVGHDIDLVNAAGNECAVSQGDALQLAGPPPADSPTANLIVLSTKGGVECKRAETVQVQITDLQEMQNHMRQTIDAGMGDMQKGKGLPTVPASASGAPLKASFVSAAPPPDQNVGEELNKQVQEADSAEKQTLASLSPDGQQPVPAPEAGQTPPLIVPPPITPTKIEMGQSIDDVVGALGQPASIVDLGAKKMYIYKDMKISFKDGKVSNVQ